MNIDKLSKILEALPKYRTKQAKEAIFKNLISDWNKATFLPLNLRQELNEKCPLEIKAEMLVSKKKDSVKAKITLDDGLLVETVLMRHKDGRNTVCVSSQVGCPLGCSFCTTGKMGFKRNLTPMEIVEQVIFFARYLKKGGKKVTNVTFMGMGEPFLNYENVMRSARIINTKEKLNIGARNISISTAGIIEGIEKFAKEGTQINLAISLHAPSNELRSKLMPINRKYHLERLLAAVDAYIKKTKRQVMFEYLLIKNVNDTESCARELARIMKKPLYYVNLILYNSTSGNNFSPSSAEKVKKFKEILKKNKVVFSQRFRFGEDIKAACGQFAGSKH
jgi:23S rRNA (adenine2503-C2)-methyltransferase